MTWAVSSLKHRSGVLIMTCPDTKAIFPCQHLCDTPTSERWVPTHLERVLVLVVGHDGADVVVLRVHEGVEQRHKAHLLRGVLP